MKKRILLIDASEVAFAMASETLAKDGYEVRTARTVWKPTPTFSRSSR